MQPRHRSLIPTQELLAFAKRHAVALGRSSPYRTLNLYVQLGLLPRKRRYSDGRIHWGFPSAAKGLLLRIRDLKQQGLRLQAIREKLDDLRAQEVERAQHAPATLGSPDDPDTPPADTNLSYFYEKAKEAQDLLRAGLNRNVLGILDELVDLAAPHEPGGALRILVQEGVPMTEVYKVSSSDSADYLCSMSAMEPLALEQSYGVGRFHCVIPGEGRPVCEYDVLIPDADAGPLEGCPPLSKPGPNVDLRAAMPYHEYTIYRVEGEQVSLLCKESLLLVTPQALGREYGRGRFRLVYETAQGARHAYGLFIPRAPVEATWEQKPGCEIFIGRTAPVARSPSPAGYQTKCPQCRRSLVKRHGKQSFVSTNGFLVDHARGTVQIKCKHCKTPITVW